MTKSIFKIICFVFLFSAISNALTTADMYNCLESVLGGNPSYIYIGGTGQIAIFKDKIYGIDDSRIEGKSHHGMAGPPDRPYCIEFDKSDPKSVLWIACSPSGRWRCNVDPNKKDTCTAENQANFKLLPVEDAGDRPFYTFFTAIERYAAGVNGISSITVKQVESLHKQVEKIEGLCKNLPENQDLKDGAAKEIDGVKKLLVAKFGPRKPTSNTPATSAPAVDGGNSSQPLQTK